MMARTYQTRSQTAKSGKSTKSKWCNTKSTKSKWCNTKSTKSKWCNTMTLKQCTPQHYIKCNTWCYTGLPV